MAVTFAFAPDALAPVLLLIVVGWLILQNVVSLRVLGSAVGLDTPRRPGGRAHRWRAGGTLGAVFGVPVAAAIASVLAVWLDVAGPPGRGAASITPSAGGPGKDRVGGVTASSE